MVHVIYPKACDAGSREADEEGPGKGAWGVQELDEEVQQTTATSVGAEWVHVPGFWS